MADTLAVAWRRVAGRWRQATAGLRVLPDFLIIGAQKSGTTSLFRYLLESRGVVGPVRKELFFFERHHTRGERWYRGCFPTTLELRARGIAQGCAQLTGEASPFYLSFEPAPARVARIVPHARLIVLMRDPVDRAWSHYRHNLRLAQEELGFREALEAEPERWATATAGRPDEFSAAAMLSAYFRHGQYADHLERWLACFPREQMLLLQAEELFRAPRQVHARTMAFLGLRDHALPEYDTHNEGKAMTMPPEVEKELARRYREPNERLFALLGQRFPNWR